MVKSQSSGESTGHFVTFEERKEEEKNTLSAIMAISKAMPSLFRLTGEETNDKVALLSEVAKSKFSCTNWIVRNSFLLCFKDLMK